MDEVAEWLRRWTANPLCSARVSSNLILVEGNILLSVLLPGSYKIIKRMRIVSFLLMHQPHHGSMVELVSTSDFESGNPSSSMDRTFVYSCCLQDF